MAKNSGTKNSFVIEKTVLHFFQNLSRASPLKRVATLPQAPNLGTNFCMKVVNHVLGQSVNHVPLDKAASPTMTSQFIVCKKITVRNGKLLFPIYPTMWASFPTVLYTKKTAGTKPAVFC